MRIRSQSAVRERLHAGRNAGGDRDHRHPGRADHRRRRQRPWAAKQTKIKVEVDSWPRAMESFKQKYGSYPPANLTLPRSSTVASNPQVNRPSRVCRPGLPQIYPAPASPSRRDVDRQPNLSRFAECGVYGDGGSGSYRFSIRRSPWSFG